MTRYEIDPAESRVWVEARSTLHPIRSESKGLRGWFAGDFDSSGALDLAELPQAVLELPLAALASGNPLYDREMRRRVDAARYPTISGELASVRAAGSAGRYEAEGALTFHGVTRTVGGEVTISAEAQDLVVIEGSQVFDVREFGVEPPRLMMLRVLPDVSVRVRVVARASPAV